MHLIGLAVLAYLGLGGLFGLWFVSLGAQRLDPSARGAGLFTRLLWLPAASLLWPVLLTRLLRSHTATGADATGGAP
ncbi:MAG: hypothetical protein AAGG11_09675 [Pseudomonadota bacterium]